MVALFHDMMHQEIEVYVDDMIANTRPKKSYVETFKKLFDRLREFKFRLNPAKCVFGATSNKLLGFIVSNKGIEIDPSKTFLVTENNHIKYLLDRPALMACILGLQAAIEMGVAKLRVFGDFALIILQTIGEWKTKDAKLLPYREYLEDVVKEFEEISFEYLPMSHNQFADALATLSSMLQVTDGLEVEPLKIEVLPKPAYCMIMTREPDGRPWYYDIMNYIQKQEFPEGTKATQIMQEVHEGVCGPHMNGHMWAKKIMRLGYYWLTLKCDYYFSKWIEATSFASVTSRNVAKFIKRDIIARYGISEAIITNNGTNLNNKIVDELFREFKIKHLNSSPYRPQMNGVVEAANKNIKKILANTTENYRDWHDRLPFALMAYRTLIRTFTRATPFALVYDMEAVLPMEVEIPSLRVLSQAELFEAEWSQQRLEQLNLIDERRLKALCHGQTYQQRVARSFNRKVRPRHFQVNDHVIRKLLPIFLDPGGKFAPNYSGPYVVKKVLPGSALILRNGWS
ncbi:uncharacterized protein LOC120296127 [Eucalyptus grandis]|uniref:uncharacterized protein LOC120296127 n=1 Tax=Eucalyptus grandis TaxID=71139 RepID=UPI00192E9B0E|nr:uncharacterized protein LOC120296127 [Eucalyptus grandis]